MRFFAFIILLAIVFILPSDIFNAIVAILFGVGLFGAFIGAFGYVLNTAKKIITKN